MDRFLYFLLHVAFGSNQRLGGLLSFSAKLCGRRPARLPVFLPQVGRDRVGLYLQLFYLLEFDNFHEVFQLYNDMAFQSSAIVASAPASVGKQKLEPRLLALIGQHGVSDKISDAMGDNGLTSCGLFKHVCTTADDVTELMKNPPFDLTGTDFATKLEIGKVRAVWEASTVNNDVEVKHNAERLRQNLPPEVSIQDLEAVVKLFKAAHGDLERHKCPSKGFFERMILQTQTCLLYTSPSPRDS